MSLRNETTFTEEDLDRLNKVDKRLKQQKTLPKTETEETKEEKQEKTQLRNEKIEKTVTRYEFGMDLIWKGVSRAGHGIQNIVSGKRLITIRNGTIYPYNGEPKRYSEPGTQAKEPQPKAKEPLVAEKPPIKKQGLKGPFDALEQVCNHIMQG